MKKSLISILICFSFLYTLPFAIFADAPDNDYVGTFILNTVDLSSGSPFAYTNSDQIYHFGDLHLLTFTKQGIESTSGRAELEFLVDFTLDQPTYFYFLTGFQDLTDLNTNDPAFSMSLKFFIDKSNNTSVDKSPIYYTDSFSYSGRIVSESYFYSYDTQEIFVAGKSYPTITSQLSFGVYPLLPAGSYSMQFRVDWTSSTGSFSVPMGFFLDHITAGNPIEDYRNGDITFSAANNALQSEIDVILNDSMLSNTEKQVLLGISDAKLSLLQSISEEKFSTVVNDFEDDSDAIVQSFILSGSTDILPAVSELNLLYTDALTQAVTPEQGQLINSRFNVRLNQIQAVFDANYKQELDNVLTDQDFSDKQEDFDRTEQLLQVESQALTIFEESRYESYLTFVDWFNTLNHDPTVYRSLFEFLFEDPRASIIQPFLIIPFSLVLVGVLLATTTIVYKRGN